MHVKFQEKYNKSKKNVSESHISSVDGTISSFIYKNFPPKSVRQETTFGVKVNTYWGYVKTVAQC